MDPNCPIPYLRTVRKGQQFELTMKPLTLASVVYQVAKEESRVTENEYFSTTDEDDLSEDIRQSKLKVNRLVEIFNNYTKERHRFLDVFPEWKKLRVETIERLNGIVELMNSTSFNCNVSKLVGESASLIGGGVCLGAAFVPPAAAVAIPLVIAGGVVSAAGGLTAFGASIADISLLKKRVQEVKSVLKTDEKLYRLMEKWVKHTQKLVKEVEDIIGLGVMKQLMTTITEFCGEIKHSDDFYSTDYNEKFRQVVRNCMKIMRGNGNVNPKFGILIEPIIMSLMFVMIAMPSKNRVAFDYLVLSADLALGAAPIIEAGVEITKACLKIAAKKTVVTAVKGVGAAHTAGAIVKHFSLPAVGIALDIACLAITSIDVHKGSVRDQALQVKKSAELLENEMQYLENMYRELIKKPTKKK